MRHDVWWAFHDSKGWTGWYMKVKDSMTMRMGVSLWAEARTTFRPCRGISLSDEVSGKRCEALNLNLLSLTKMGKANARAAVRHNRKVSNKYTHSTSCSPLSLQCLMSTVLIRVSMASWVINSLSVSETVGRAKLGRLLYLDSAPSQCYGATLDAVTAIMMNHHWSMNFDVEGGMKK
jgi:hypothetical protein